MDPNNPGTIESFVRSMEEATHIVRHENPDVIVAPLMGAGPLVDVMNIVDGEFPNERIEYVPASSRLHRARDVMRCAFENIIRAYCPDGGRVLSIDEVVSGSSVLRVFKQFDAARMNYANRKTLELFGEDVDFREDKVRAFRDEVYNSIVYKSLGIVDSKMRRLGKRMITGYDEHVNNGVIIPVDTDQIVTMDRVGFFPVKYKAIRKKGERTIYLPEVEGFDVSREYMDFLLSVAEITGIDPETVTVSNMGKIMLSNRWVPDYLTRIE